MAGNRLRITAQLIKADDGTHIWAEDYDRELTDVFAVQEDIARAHHGGGCRTKLRALHRAFASRGIGRVSSYVPKTLCPLSSTESTP
jgi:hypothetical protein